MLSAPKARLGAQASLPAIHHVSSLLWVRVAHAVCSEITPGSAGIPACKQASDMFYECLLQFSDGMAHQIETVIMSRVHPE